MTDYDMQTISYLANDQYLTVMREKVGPDTYDMLGAVTDNKDLPRSVREMASVLKEEYGTFDEQDGAALGLSLRTWHASAWHFLQAVRGFEEVGR